LLVEGSYATIIANKIEKSIKANIALGGAGCGKTRILYNLIDASKSEGVFVIEGEDNLLIEENEVVGNHDGIVLVESMGTVKGNVIKENQRSGILTANNTKAMLDSNIIEENWTAGILIKDPSLPEMRKNEVSKNYYQVQMEAHAKPKWEFYIRENPRIIGNNEIPKATCTIF
jgi:parallel beta-helix repeat protein